MHDTAQLVAQGQLNNDEQSIEMTNVFKNETKTGLRYDKVVITLIKGMTNDIICGGNISSYKSFRNAGVGWNDLNWKQNYKLNARPIN